MNSFLQVWDMFSFVFWKKLKTPKRHFEINWPLSPCKKSTFWWFGEGGCDSGSFRFYIFCCLTCTTFGSIVVQAKTLHFYQQQKLSFYHSYITDSTPCSEIESFPDLLIQYCVKTFFSFTNIVCRRLSPALPASVSGCFLCWEDQKQRNSKGLGIPGYFWYPFGT